MNPAVVTICWATWMSSARATNPVRMTEFTPFGMMLIPAIGTALRSCEDRYSTSAWTTISRDSRVPSTSTSSILVTPGEMPASWIVVGSPSIVRIATSPSFGLVTVRMFFRVPIWSRVAPFRSTTSGFVSGVHS